MNKVFERINEEFDKATYGEPQEGSFTIKEYAEEAGLNYRTAANRVYALIKAGVLRRLNRSNGRLAVRYKFVEEASGAVAERDPAGTGGSDRAKHKQTQKRKKVAD